MAGSKKLLKFEVKKGEFILFFIVQSTVNKLWKTLCSEETQDDSGLSSGKTILAHKITKD